MFRDCAGMMEGQGKLFLLPLAACPLIVSGVGVCFLDPAGDLVSVSVSLSYRTQEAILIMIIQSDIKT